VPKLQPATAPAAPRAKTVSLVIALILIIVGTVAGLAVGYYAAPRSTGASSLCSSGQTFTLGALLDLSKDLSSQGNRAKRSTAMAIDDVNAFLSTGGCTSKFAISVSDYQLDNAMGATDLAAFASSGIQVVVGPSPHSNLGVESCTTLLTKYKIWYKPVECSSVPFRSL